MKISTKGRYALRMMLDLATHQGDGYVALKDIAQRQEISKKYLEQIVPMLGKSNILRTTRGYQGGYRLARAPQDYTVGEILRLTEGGLAPVACLDQHRRVRHPSHVGRAGARHLQLPRRHHAAGPARAADGTRRERLRHLTRPRTSHAGPASAPQTANVPLAHGWIFGITRKAGV